MEIDVKDLVIDDLKMEVENLKKQNEEYDLKIKQLQEDLCIKQSEVIKYMEWYDTIRNSTIWKISKPFRLIKDCFRRNVNS